MATIIFQSVGRTLPVAKGPEPIPHPISPRIHQPPLEKQLKPRSTSPAPQHPHLRILPPRAQPEEAGRATYAPSSTPPPICAATHAAPSDHSPTTAPPITKTHQTQKNPIRLKPASDQPRNPRTRQIPASSPSPPYPVRRKANLRNLSAGYATDAAHGWRASGGRVRGVVR